jgi:hypothetical protein
MHQCCKSSQYSYKCNNIALKKQGASYQGMWNSVKVQIVNRISYFKGALSQTGMQAFSRVGGKRYYLSHIK